MNDLISRQAAIKALADDMPQTYTPDGSHYADDDIFKAQEIYADCIQRLEELPSAQPEQKWIPCTERLPEKNGTYLCSERYFMYVDDFKNGEWQLTNMAYAKPIAWMPLPEPYKEENR